ncbi:hypothetical protein D4R49_00370 [bacterium]|nr:MAG: hypothetical protein D4R49_00370 [bacterium]
MVNYPFLKNSEQNIVINAVEEFSYVTLKRVSWLCAISAHGTKHVCEDLNAFVVSFADSARKGMCDIGRLKNRIQGGKHRVVQNTITNIRFVDMSELGVLDIKVGIWSMPITLCFQIPMQIKYVALKFFLECEHILLHTLAAFEFVPCAEERLRGDDFFKNVFVNFHI